MTKLTVTIDIVDIDGKETLTVSGSREAFRRIGQDDMGIRDDETLHRTRVFSEPFHLTIQPKSTPAS